MAGTKHVVVRQYTATGVGEVGGGDFGRVQRHDTRFHHPASEFLSLCLEFNLCQFSVVIRDFTAKTVAGEPSVEKCHLFL